LAESLTPSLDGNIRPVVTDYDTVTKLKFTDAASSFQVPTVQLNGGTLTSTSSLGNGLARYLFKVSVTASSQTVSIQLPKAARFVRLDALQLTSSNAPDAGGITLQIGYVLANGQAVVQQATNGSVSSASVVITGGTSWENDAVIYQITFTGTANTDTLYGSFIVQYLL
jgi:hypothetical protein